MTATLTYSPLTPQNLAGYLRASHRPPFTNHDQVTALPSRVAISISATPPPFRHTTYRFWPRQVTSVWRNLQQYPRNDGSFTFSAKERDSETGLSYFGSRYYSSDLSIWLSVDPMAAKYPSLSPYVYCANNPVKLVDPNGDSIINGLKYAYDYFLQQCNLAIEKCLKLDYNSNPIEYSNVKKEYDKASKNLEDVSCFYKTAEVAISNVKKYNKQLYNQMNNIKDDKGNAVDIVVLVNYSIGKYGNHSIPIQSLCPPSIIVQLNPIAKFDKYKDMGEVLSHEFGHLLYIIPNWSDYQNFLKTVNPSRHNGHDHDDPSGQEAHKQTQIYILNKIKQP